MDRPLRPARGKVGFRRRLPPATGRPAGKPSAPLPPPRGQTTSGYARPSKKDTSAYTSHWQRRKLRYYARPARRKYVYTASYSGAPSSVSRPQPVRAGKATRSPPTYSRHVRMSSPGQRGPWVFQRRAKYGKNLATTARRQRWRRFLINSGWLPQFRVFNEIQLHDGTRAEEESAWARRLSPGQARRPLTLTTHFGIEGPLQGFLSGRHGFPCRQYWVEAPHAIIASG